MPQFDVHTYASQLFWLCVCMSCLWAGFTFVIVPRHLKNQNARRHALHHMQVAIDQHQQTMRTLYEQSVAVIQEAEQKAKEDFNKARHYLDQEDQKLRHDGLMRHRDALQKHRHNLVQQNPDDQTQEIVHSLKCELVDKLTKVRS